MLVHLLAVEKTEVSEHHLASLENQVVSVHVEKSTAAKPEHLGAHGILQTQLSCDSSKHL